MRNNYRQFCEVATVNHSPATEWSRAQELQPYSPLSGIPPEMIVGRRLGHYRLVERISRGGMGIVYRAQDENLEREVALKVLAPAFLGDAIARKRFHNEALILSKLHHPNVIAVHDFETQDGIDFLVMEYVPGHTLSTKLETGPISEGEVLHIARQVAAAVQEAHDCGIVHRDLKPQNIMLTPRGQVKVGDFGVAELLFPVIGPPPTKRVIRDFEVVGTLPYMPPEQLLGSRADFRSDIYSAGAVLYELVTGRRPFPETHRLRLLDSILHGVPSPPSALIPSLSRRFEIVIGKCLEKDPKRRYQAAAELAMDLEIIASPGARKKESGRQIRISTCRSRFSACRLTRRRGFAQCKMQ